ncbi:hypothetical protein N5T61_09925, partial [Aliarcobacter cryaerophilus]
MANLAQIQSIAQGQFFVKDSLGNLTELKVGDTVSLNDTIVAASSNTDLSKIEILFDTNELITLSQGEQLLDATLLASTFGNEELAFDKQEVDETLNAWNNAQDGDATDMETAAGDVTEQATNAGNEEAADGGALRSKFNSRDGDATDIVSNLRDTSFGGGNTEEPQEQIPTELLNPVATGTGTITDDKGPDAPIDEDVKANIEVSNAIEVQVTEKNGATLTYEVKLSNAVGKNVEVDLTTGGDATRGSDYENTLKYSTDNGATYEAVPSNGKITLPANGSSVLVQVTVKDDAITESDETVTLTATTIDAQITTQTATGTGTILDNDEHTVTVDPTDPTDPNTPD